MFESPHVVIEDGDASGIDLFEELAYATKASEIKGKTGRVQRQAQIHELALGASEGKHGHELHEFHNWFVRTRRTHAMTPADDGRHRLSSSRVVRTDSRGRLSSTKLVLLIASSVADRAASASPPM